MKKSVAAVAILLIAALGFLGYIGYLGGPVFRLVPARGNARGMVAVLVSGDLGFRIGMGPEIADRIAAHGIPVIGVNALTYFRTERTTDEATTLLSQAIARARALPGARRVVVIGQSFGADMVQHVFARLPQAVRRDIPLLVLTVPADSTAMQAMPAGLFGYGPGVPSLPTARRIADVPVLCIHGAEETDSLCPLWRAANVTRVALPGGHPLHRDPDAVATTILTAIARTVAPRRAPFATSRENDMKPVALAAAMLALTAAAPMPHEAVAGTWINPHGSVAVRTGTCQGKLCGWIVWANAEAKADAKDAGVDQLVGTALLKDYVPAGNGSWQGNVFVPDMGRSFSSTIAAVGPSTLKVKGCLIGGFICRSQLWRRIASLPDA